MDGDYRHLNDTYIGSADKFVDELNALIYDDDGNCLVNFQNDFPVQDVKEGAFVIGAGCLP